MKKYVLLVVVSTLIFNVAVFAQDVKPDQRQKGEKRDFKKSEKTMISPEKRAGKMAKELGLNDAEKAKVQALFEKQAAKRDKRLAEVKKFKEDQETAIATDRKSMDDELVSIIGKEKFQQLENKRSEMKTKMAERSGRFHHSRFERMNRMKAFNGDEKPMVSPQDRAERMAKVLDLTANQKSQVQALFEKQAVAMKQQMADVKKMKEEQMSKMKENREAQQADLEKIIGTEKFKQLESKRDDHHEKMEKRQFGNRMMPQQMNGQMKNRKPMEKGQITPEKRAERMAQELGLTDGQKADVQKLFVKQDAFRVQHQAEITKIREDQKAKFETTRNAQDDELAKIIGNDKFKKFEALRSEMQSKMKMRMEKMNKWRNYPNDSTFHDKRLPEKDQKKI